MRRQLKTAWLILARPLIKYYIHEYNADMLCAVFLAHAFRKTAAARSTRARIVPSGGERPEQIRPTS